LAGHRAKAVPKEKHALIVKVVLRAIENGAWNGNLNQLRLADEQHAFIKS
jgi:hypothetical protein